MAISVDPRGRKLRLARGTNIAVAAPLSITEAELRKVGKGILGHAKVKGELGKNRSRLLALEPLLDFHEGPPLAKPTRFRATIYDYVKNRALIAHASQGRGRLNVEATSRRAQPLPSAEEWDDAVAVIRADPELGRMLEAKEIATYPAMPPLSEREGKLGEIERALHVGLRPLGGSQFKNTIVAANLIRRVVERYERGAPDTAIATASLCGAPDPVSFPSPPRGTQGSLWISWPADNPVWHFMVVRPSASSGTRGSGVEIRFADYGGKRVLTHGHVPILNVQYDANACGPFRDWQWQEHNFVANGTDLAPGFRWCSDPPQTIIDNGSDAGNFNGVAIYEDPERTELLLVSEMTAGWYRYISEWRFSAAGWIKPCFKFAAVDNSCVCKVHNHHSYWRLNFNTDDPGNDIVEEWSDGTGWAQLTNEIKRYRDPATGRKWRIRDPATGSSYEIIPGATDSTALDDAYARGDAWFLRNNPLEIDDGFNGTVGPGTAINLDPFLTGESIDRQDVVVWYGGHWRHENAPGHAGEDHSVGPVIVPSWCTAQASGDGVLSADDLQVLRDFRDGELHGVEAGREYVAWLGKLTEEVVQIALGDERIRQVMGSVAKGVAEEVRKMRSPRPLPSPIPDTLLAEAGTLLDLLEPHAGELLEPNIFSARADVGRFRGLALREALETMVGPR
jgi:hypothetical protein